jgi:signal peptidase I
MIILLVFIYILIFTLHSIRLIFYFFIIIVPSESMIDLHIGRR